MGVLVMFLGEDGTPFQSREEEIEARDEEGLAILTFCQREEIFALHAVHHSSIPRSKMRVIVMVDASLPMA